jgi:hypothetical protein
MAGAGEHRLFDVLNGAKGARRAKPETAPRCARPAGAGRSLGIRRLGGLAARALRPPAVLHDEYLDWLTIAVAGMQVPGNLYLFDVAIATAPAAPMLEIGSFCGLSTNIIGYLKAKHGRRDPLFSVDKWIFEGAERELPPEAPVDRHDLREFVIESFERAVQTFSPSDPPYAIEATSDEFFEMWRDGRTVRERFGRDVGLGGPFGFAFIDGNHSAEFATRDFLNCDEHLLPGGLILFDDSDDLGEWGVRQAISHVKSTGRYEVVAKNPNYLVRKRA